jgi:hypothetical protein
MYLIAFPLLLIPFVLYNMIAFLLGIEFSTTVVTMPLLSGARMPVSMGDLLVVFSILLLYLEILKATRLSSKAMIDHVLSVVLFSVMVVEFMVVPPAATSSFMLLMTLSFIDVIGGLTITIRTAQRDPGVDGVERAHPH